MKSWRLSKFSRTLEVEEFKFDGVMALVFVSADATELPYRTALDEANALGSKQETTGESNGDMLRLYKDGRATESPA